MYISKKIIIWTLVALLGASGLGYSGCWSYTRLKGAEQAFAYLASAPQGQSKSRAELLDNLLKTPATPAPPTK